MKKSKPLPAMAQMARNARRAETLMKQLANASRLRVLCHLVSGERTVNELIDISGLSQSALSQHLAKLRAAKLVGSEKRGKNVYYRIISMEAQAILSTLHLIYCR